MRSVGPDTARAPLAGAVLPFLFAFVVAPPLSGCYLSHLARGQIDVSRSAVSIEEAMRRPELSEADKAKLALVQEIRSFAETSIGLKPSKNYTTYLPGKKGPLVWVVTASRKDSLTPVTWKFPVVGEVAYRSYFDLKEAEAERDRLAAEGYDVYLRPARAYSTLGWFTDPVTPLMLDLDEGELAELIIHELSHGTVYPPGQATYGESFAQFVAREGARQFLLRRHGPDSPAVRAYDDRLADERLYDAFMGRAVERLRALYASRPADLEAARRGFFEGMRRDYDALRPKFHTAAYARAGLRTLNNAVLIGHLIYADTAPFEEAFAAFRGDWQKFVEAASAAAKDPDPARRLRALSAGAR